MHTSTVYPNSRVLPKHDTNVLDPRPSAIFVAGTGNLVFDTTTDETVTVTAIPIGFYPISPKRLKTGTTVAQVIGLW